ncbi:transcriptional regulator [Microbacterium sp. AISO3]|jgi:DNA-binding HxlR family transcriptional regulator|uniref:Transcriptional regulator n=1 Tax=Microbacterium arborescens TaxID=33883 RepID=A0ABX2WIC0_9MICO|nr:MULTISPECIES: helix-turn-helix domain-containing protein [Microbacterium]APF33846.1 transcriptional regulator [Microbacterium paludicola]OAZ40787.1 transcriptional regulator [Microbacterium arborescens]OWP21126.1 transcriptional regulator [Microbacterium sp. AISO3]POX67544.1 transcriptional regulator [Microbacterium sp. Ru50]QCR39803.1 transcriptional regulator [Microbacterium sp. SGAir0570]
MAVSFAQIRASSDQVFTENCPTRVVLDHVMSKWGVLVLLALTDGTARWGELRRSVAGISEKMLASTLRTLEADGIVSRTAYPEVPPRVEYALTERGVELMERMMPLMEWIAANADDIVGRPA